LSRPSFKIGAIMAFAATCATAQAASPDHYRIRTAGELVAVCSTAPGAQDHATAVAFCHGVLAGAYGYYDAATPAAQRFVCVPDPAPKRAQVAEEFVAWSKARPQLMNNHAVDTLFRFAAEQYPCR